jgi:hypothetical protein
MHRRRLPVGSELREPSDDNARVGLRNRAALADACAGVHYASPQTQPSGSSSSGNTRLAPIDRSARGGWLPYSYCLVVTSGGECELGLRHVDRVVVVHRSRLTALR